MASVEKRKKTNGIFAAVGAATGLGNAFRFPALCVSYGAAFVFAYAAALCLVCFPLLCAELRFGRVKAVGKAAKIWSAIIRAAAVNSALIALYYGVIAAKLGSQSLNFIIYADCAGGSENGSTALFVLTTVALLVGAYALLKGGSRALSVSGKVSVFASVALFLPLAIAGIIRGGAFSRLDWSILAGGSVWADAIGQALLALSLAAGVMPTFARTQKEPFSAVRSALKISVANFVGCLLATASTQPFVTFISQTVGVTCGIMAYNQVIFALAHGKWGVRVMGFAVFGALTAVALHSLCSLAFPAVSALEKRIKHVPLVFCAAAALSAPLFLCGNLEVLSSCDRMACSVTAVCIALSECLFFASQRHIRGVIGFFMRFFCPLAFLALTLFSLGSARFNGFSPFAAVCAYLCFFAVILSAALPYLTFLAKRVKMSISRRYCDTA